MSSAEYIPVCLFISCNPNIAIELILAYPHLPWNWARFYRNQNLTMDIILENPQIPWSWDSISENQFLCDKRSKRYQTIQSTKEILSSCLNIMPAVLIYLVKAYVA
jgi:hypothetical protein